MTPQTLEQYLADNLDRGITDHTLRARRDESGKIVIYVHPTRVGGRRLDFEVEANGLLPVVTPN